MYYSIRHQTRFRYSTVISESVMKVFMQPRSEGNQRCLEFSLYTEPASDISSSRDSWGNVAHHFNIPGRHAQLTITSEALVQLTPPDLLPNALALDAWDELDNLTATDEHWFTLQPSYYTQFSPLLHAFAEELHLQRRDDPLTVLCELNSSIYRSFEYVPHSTTVDSPIDLALSIRKGVCQDFAHIMIALVRLLGIPCRYVSGYLHHRKEDQDRSEEDATHAWLEAFLPGLGWVGFDPTNDLIAYDRHIRTAVGSDYADVPPTLGVFKGDADSELDVGVRVEPTEAPIPEDLELLPVVEWAISVNGVDDHHVQQQQQQQQ